MTNINSTTPNDESEKSAAANYQDSAELLQEKAHCFLDQHRIPMVFIDGQIYQAQSIDLKAKIFDLVQRKTGNDLWQSNYWLSHPVSAPKGSRIICSATFDNSKENPFNPDPTVRVTWGEQTWQEMMLASWEYYEMKQ